jgi:hypothetical protein
MKQKLAEPASEFVDAQIAFEDAIVANGNLASFLRNHYGDRVGFFRQPEGCPVTQPKVTVQVLALGERENAGCRNHSVVVDDQSAVVQNRLRVEDRERKLLGIGGVQLDTGFDEGFKRDFAFHRDQGTEALAGDFKGRIGEFLNGFTLFEGGSEERVTAEIGKCPAKFRLKDYNQSDSKKDR